MSSDAASWDTAWTGTLAGRTIRAAIDDGRTVTVRLPVDRKHVRDVRLRATGPVEQPRWTIADLAAFGRCTGAP